MTLALPLQGNRARYNITVVSHENDPSGKESKRFSRKGYSRAKNIGKKIGVMFIAALIAGLLLMGNISAAPAAKAGDWGLMNGLRDVICGTAYFNADPDSRGLGPNTADPKLMDITKNKITAYEKYGMAGTTWTVWLGPEDHGQISGDGDVAGKQLVAMNGGKNSLNNWAVKEKYGKDQPYSSFYNTKGQCSPIGDAGPTAVGNFLMSVTSWIVNISNLLFQTATETSSSVLETLSPTIVVIVSKLKDALYLEFLAPILMMGSLYLAWKGLVKRSSTEAGTAAVWMLGATVAGFAILANPMFLPSVVNKVVSTVSETTIASITQVAQAKPSTSGASTSTSSLCTVNGNNGKTKVTDSNGKVTITNFSASQNSARTSVRQIQCTMWYSFMYTPWVIGQFGVSPSSADAAVLNTGYPNKPGDTIALGEIPTVIGLGSGSSPGNWALYQLDNKVNYPGSNKAAQQQAMLNVAASQLYTSNPNDVWKGASSMNRVTTATLAMISALGAGAMIAFVSMSMIILQIGLVILTLFSALFLLVGVHPGFGRRIAMGWLESMAGLAMKRIVLSVLLSVMLVFYSAVLSASASIDWLLSMIMVIAVSLGGISYKDQLTSMFSRISFGGNGGLTEQGFAGQNALKNTAKRAVGGTARAAGGIVGTATAMGVGGAIGAIAGGAGARKNNKDLREKAREEIAARKKDGGDDPAAGAGERPNSAPDDDPSTNQSDGGAGERPGDAYEQEALFEDDAERTQGPSENPADLATGRHAEPSSEEIDGQGHLFPEADVRPKQPIEVDPRMADDVAAGQERVNQQRQRVNARAGINGYRPANEADGRRAMIAKAQEEALKEHTRYNRFHKINTVKNKFANKIDSSKSKVERTVGMIGNSPKRATNAVNRSIAKSTPVKAVSSVTSSVTAAARARAAAAKNAANSYHTLAKTHSPTYNKSIERHNQKKVVKQERHADKQEIKKIVSAHPERISVAGEAMRHAHARGRARVAAKKNSDLARMVKKVTRGR